MQSGVNICIDTESQFEMNEENYWRLDNNNEIKEKPLSLTKYSRTSLSSISFPFGFSLVAFLLSFMRQRSFSCY